MVRNQLDSASFYWFWPVVQWLVVKTVVLCGSFWEVFRQISGHSEIIICTVEQSICVLSCYEKGLLAPKWTVIAVQVSFCNMFSRVIQLMRIFFAFQMISGQHMQIQYNYQCNYYQTCFYIYYRLQNICNFLNVFILLSVLFFLSYIVSTYVCVWNHSVFIYLYGYYIHIISFHCAC